MRGCAVCKQGLRVGAKWGLPPDQSLTLSPSLNLLCTSFSSHSHSYLITFSSFSSSKWGLSIPFPVSKPQHFPLLTKERVHAEQSMSSDQSPTHLPSTLQQLSFASAVASLFLTCAHFLQPLNATALPFHMAQDDDDDRDKVYISQSIPA